MWENNSVTLRWNKETSSTFVPNFCSHSKSNIFFDNWHLANGAQIWWKANNFDAVSDKILMKLNGIFLEKKALRWNMFPWGTKVWWNLFSRSDKTKASFKFWLTFATFFLQFSQAKTFIPRLQKRCEAFFVSKKVV